MKKITAGRKVNNVKRRLVSALLLATVTLSATGSVWESPAETVQAAPSMGELQNRINNHQNQLNNINSQINSLQDEVNKTLLHDEYYYPTDERTIQECLDGDYILLGVYNDVGVKSPRL